MVWILVVSPPRERLRMQDFDRFFFAVGRVLMDAHEGAVDYLDLATMGF